MKVSTSQRSQQIFPPIFRRRLFSNPVGTRLRALPIALLCVGLLGACELTEGAEGEMTFADQTTGDVNLTNNLAVGATVKITAACWLCTNQTVSEVTIADPSVVTFVGDNGQDFVLRGVSPGETEVTVRMGDVSDRLTISVAEIASSTTRLQPWFGTDLLPGSLWSEGFGVFAGDRFRVRAFPKDANGDRTTGFGGISWQVTDGDATLEEVPDRSSDSVDIAAPAAPGMFTVTPSVGASQEFRVVTPEDIDRLVVYASDGSLEVNGDVSYADGETLTLAANTFFVLHLAAYTEDGVYVAGDAGQPATLTISEGAEELITDAMAQIADENGEPDLGNDTARGFVVFTSGELGTGTLTLEWAERSFTLPFEVVESVEEDAP